MTIHNHPEHSPVKQFFPFSDNDDFESLILEIQPRFIPILERIRADKEGSFCKHFRVTHPEIDPIMDLISEYQSNSIILFSSEWYLCATMLEDKSNYQNVFVVPLENLITKLLDDESIEEDFFRNFGGLSQNLIPDCLRFSPKLYLSNGDYFDSDGNELTDLVNLRRNRFCDGRVGRDTPILRRSKTSGNR